MFHSYAVTPNLSEPVATSQSLYILYLMLIYFYQMRLLSSTRSGPKGRGRCSGWNGSYFRPFVPIKPSSLPFRQSLQTNGGHNYSASGHNKAPWAPPPDHFPLPFAQQFQFPKLSDSPTTAIGRMDSMVSDNLTRKNDSLVQLNGRANHHDHHRTLPPLDRNITQRKAMIITDR